MGSRTIVVLVLFACGVLALVSLSLTPADFWPRAGGARIAREFFAAALRPALTYEAVDVPPGAPPFLLRLAASLWRTLLFASAAMSLALPAGAVLGVLASRPFWAGENERSHPVASALRVFLRLLVALMRSVHELLWAVIFLAAFGLNSASAVLAIAIPFAGTLAKVFAEMLDEAPRESAQALRTTGASRGHVFLFGLLPRALPDTAAYAFYRYECAVRSSAVLGFFGLPTIGYHLAASFENLHYREVWAYLYALFALVFVLESWSASLRKRFVA